MKNYAFLTGAVLFLSLSAFSFLFLTGCQKEPERTAVEGIVTFTIGSVDIHKADGGSQPADISSRVAMGDTVISGSNSQATIQISDVGAVQIAEKTTLRFDDLFSEDKTEITLSEGQVSSKVSRLRRGESFNVKTPTSVAAVRGTEFSTSYNPVTQSSSVAVREGRISVMTPRKSADPAVEEIEYVESATLEAGSAAEVSLPEVDPETSAEVEPVVRTREITPAERLAIERVAIVPMVENVEIKTREEIEQSAKPAAEETERIEREIQEERVREEEQKKEEREIARKQEVNRLIKNESATIEEIQRAFERVDEITLYSGRVIKGAIISRGDTLEVLTETGTHKVDQTDIQNIRVVR